MDDSPIARTAAFMAKMLALTDEPAPFSATVYQDGGMFQMLAMGDVVAWASNFGTRVVIREYAEYVDVFTDLPTPVYPVKAFAHMAHDEARKMLHALGKTLCSAGVAVDAADLISWIGTAA